MYEDDTIRLFGVTNMLKNKKNKSDNWENDDIPDIKHQELTGKYDNNFDAPGSDFQRAHNYNFNNEEQPENTKTDINYDKDKYTRFFNYTPSKYIQLEEDEYKPIGKYNEKADEYYIDNLEGKTIDDMIIGKMKENAGANDLPKDAARRQFVDDMLFVEEDIGGGEMVTKLFDGKPKTKKEVRDEQNTRNEEIKILRPNFKNMINNTHSLRNQRYDNVVAENYYEEKQEEKEPKKKQEGFNALFKNAVKNKNKKDRFGFLDENIKKKGMQEGINALQNNIVGRKYKRIDDKKVDAFNKIKNEKGMQEGINALQSNIVGKKHKRIDDKKVEAFNEIKNKNLSKKQLAQGLEAFSNNVKRVKFKKAPENEKIVKLAQKNQKINPIQLTYNSPSQNPPMPPQTRLTRGGKTKTITEILAEPQQPSKEKAEAALKILEKVFTVDEKKPSPAKSEKTDVASYMGSTESDLEKIKVKKGHHPNTQSGLESHQQQKLEAGLPKYALSLETINQEYNNPKELISIEIKREINDRIGKTFFPLRDGITVKDALSKLNDEVERRTPRKSNLTLDAVSKHNDDVGSPLINKNRRNASKDLTNF